MVIVFAIFIRKCIMKGSNTGRSPWRWNAAGYSVVWPWHSTRTLCAIDREWTIVHRAAGQCGLLSSIRVTCCTMATVFSGATITSSDPSSTKHPPGWCIIPRTPGEGHRTVYRWSCYISTCRLVSSKSLFPPWLLLWHNRMRRVSTLLCNFS